MQKQLSYILFAFKFAFFKFAFFTFAIITTLLQVQLTFANDYQNKHQNEHHNDHQLKEASKCIKLISKYEKIYQLPPNILLAIAIKETGRAYSGSKKLKSNTVIPWAWSVNTGGKGYYFISKKEAVKFVREQVRSGNINIDVGVAQINLRAHPSAFESIEQSFDPEVNLHYAAYLLQKHYLEYKNWFKSIAAYHSKTEKFGSQYANNVLQILKNIDKYISFNN